MKINMDEQQVLYEVLARLKVRVSQHPTGTIILRGNTETVLVYIGDQGWRVKWPAGNVEDYIDLTKMVHRILKWSWTDELHGTDA